MTHQHLQSSSSSSSPSSSSSSSQECGIIVIVITRVWTHRHQGHRGSTSSSTRYSTQLQCFTDCIKFLLRMLVFIIIIWLNGQSDGDERRSNAFFLRVWWEKYLPATDSFYFNFLVLFFSIIIWLNGQSDGDERRSNTFFFYLFSASYFEITMEPALSKRRKTQLLWQHSECTRK